MPKQSVGDRLMVFLNYKGLTIRELADALGYTRSEKLLRLVREHDAQPNYTTIMDVSNHFPEMNIEWWLKGNGTMLQETDEFGKEEDAAIAVILKSNLPDADKNILLVRLVKDYKDENKRLMRELELFGQMLELKKSKG
jgi:hypothetical protein